MKLTLHPSTTFTALGLFAATAAAQGPSIFPSTPTNFATGTRPQSVAIGDFNKDGRPDLVTTNEIGNGVDGNLSVLLGTGNGNYGPASKFNYAPNGTNETSVAVADVNGDGNLDIVTSDHFLFGTGTGSFSAPSSYSGGGTYVAVADLNNDGIADIVTASNLSVPLSPGIIKVATSLGLGGGSFAAPTSVNIDLGTGYTLHATAIAIGDLNADGKRDVVVSVTTPTAGAPVPGHVVVLLGTGTGAFTAPAALALGLVTPRGLALGDVTGDGKLDIVTANISGSVAILTGTGTGSYSAPNFTSVGGFPRSVTLGDVNGDSRLDIVTANFGSSPTVGTTVSLLLGTGGGNFAPFTNFQVGSEPWSAAIGDLNGDGRLDVVAANYTGNNVSVLLNQLPPALTGSAVAIRRNGSYVGNGVLLKDPSSSTSSRFVLTSAHLMDATGSTSPVTFTVEAGSNTLGSGTIFNVANMAFYSKRPADGNWNCVADLALIELKSPVVFNANTKPATLASPNSLYTGVTALVEGWSKSGCSGGITPVIQDKLMTVISTSQAQSQLSSFPGTCVSDWNMALYDSANVVTNYAGSSGAGYYVSDANGARYLAAIHSWGISSGGCPLPSYPTMGIRLTSAYQNWIQYMTQLATNDISIGKETPGLKGPQAITQSAVPAINMPSLTIQCTNAPPSSLGLGIVTDAVDAVGSDPFGIGIQLHVDLFASTEVYGLDAYSDSTGVGTVATPIPNNPYLIGKTYYAQILWAWPQSMGSLPPNNLSMTKAMAMPIQPGSSVPDPGSDPWPTCPPVWGIPGGKVVFVSERYDDIYSNQRPQLYLKKDVRTVDPPQRLTSSIFGAFYPQWSPNGQYILYKTKDIVDTSGWSLPQDTLEIITETGALKIRLKAGTHLGIQYLAYPQWSRDGKRILFTASSDSTFPWGSPEIAHLKMITFNTAYDFNGGYTVTDLVPSAWNGGIGSAEGNFSSDDQFVYFEAAKDANRGDMWKVSVLDPSIITPVVDEYGTQIVRAFAESISPDGKTLMFNSEMWKVDPVTYDGEEIMQLDLATGHLTQLTNESGNQYGAFALGVGAGEYVKQSILDGVSELYLVGWRFGTRVELPLFVGALFDGYTDYQASWYAE